GLLTLVPWTRFARVANQEVRLELWLGTVSQAGAEPPRQAHVEWTGKLSPGRNRLPAVRLGIPPLLASGRVREPGRTENDATYVVSMHDDEPWRLVRPLATVSRTASNGAFALWGLSKRDSLQISVNVDSCVGGRFLFPETCVPRGTRDVSILGAEFV